MPSSLYSRRRFLRQLLGAGTLAAGGLEPLLLRAAAPADGAPEAFRFAFVTDLHLMKEGGLRSAEGIAACLGAVEKLDPRPEFILVGGDLIHDGREADVAEAEQRLRLFLKIWNDSTALPARWVFGNHDLVGTSNPDASPADPRYGKGLFKEQLHLPQLYYGFAHRGWRFIILDDIAPQPGETYIAELFDDELAFARASLDANRAAPTVVCTHIPFLSNLSLALGLLRSVDSNIPSHDNLVCTNAGSLTNGFPGHDVRAVLCGHLHHYERLTAGGIPYVNSGAVCGNFWQGPMMGCPEGFGVVDLGADRSFQFDYRPYGWKAA